MSRAFLVATATMVSGTAVAQRVPVPPEPSRPGEDLKEGVRADSKNTRRIMQEFARCVTRRDAFHVEHFLDTRGHQLSGALSERAGECLGDAAGDNSMAKGQADTFRYALAEAYLVRKYRDAGLGDVAGIAPLDHHDEVGQHQETGLGTLSECIIRKAPRESWALLRTDAASPSEKAAFAALGPAMQACVSRGSTVNMPAFFMRGSIADTYYLLSKAPRVASGVAK
jgi:hypothetical protein